MCFTCRPTSQQGSSGLGYQSCEKRTVKPAIRVMAITAVPYLSTDLFLLIVLRESYLQIPDGRSRGAKKWCLSGVKVSVKLVRNIWHRRASRSNLKDQSACKEVTVDNPTYVDIVFYLNWVTKLGSEVWYTFRGTFCFLECIERIQILTHREHLLHAVSQLVYLKRNMETSPEKYTKM
jgi:hypothetical protein